MHALNDLHAELHDRVADGAERLEIPGVAVGVLLGDDEDYVYHGVTSIEHPLPVDETTLFQIGSTGKTYTGTAIMALVERGLVELDAPVRRYLPDFRVQDAHVSANVTVLHLLNHTAGWAGDFEVDTGYGDDALARFIACMAAVPQEHPLGERVSYNNSALVVAGRIIEVVTGQTYDAAIADLVIAPLGLTEHCVFPWEIMTRRFAAGHARRDGVLRTTGWYEPRAGHPAGGVISSSARDQLRYAGFHLGDGAGVLKRETLQQMQTLTTPPSNARSGAFGITWMLRDIAGTRLVEHGGSCRGHQSGFLMAPEHDFAIVVLTNASHGIALVTELNAWALEAYLGVAERVPDPLPLSGDELATYAGEYVASTGVIHVVVDGDRLIGTLAVNPENKTDEDAGDVAPQLIFKILPADQLLVIDGPYAGLRGGILRDADGRASALDVGRVFTRRS